MDCKKEKTDKEVKPITKFSAETEVFQIYISRSSMLSHSLKGM